MTWDGVNCCIMCKVLHDNLTHVPEGERWRHFYIRGYPLCWSCDRAIMIAHKRGNHLAIQVRISLFLLGVCDEWTYEGVGCDFL